MNKRRIVITGMGTVNALGHTLNDSWQAIKNGVSGIAPVTAWDANLWDYSLIGEIKNFDLRKALPDRKLLKLLSRHDVFGLFVVPQALTDSHWLEYRDTVDATQFNESTGIYVGSPGNKFYQQYDFLPLLAESKGDLKKFAENLSSTVHPTWLLQILPNNVLAYAGIQQGFKGPNQNIVNHGVSGSQAIIEAFHAIQSGQIERALVIGYESLLDLQAQKYYAALGVQSKTALRPFDQQRDGMIVGEGAAALTLETYDEAHARGATIYGEILGGATTSEATGVFQIEASGEGVRRALQNALDQARLHAQDLGLIVAHGNGTPLSDSSEAQAILNVLDNHVAPVTAYKWALGHTLGAAGVIETALTLNALREKIAPGIATLQQVAEDCRNLCVSAEHQSLSSPVAAIINRGFAGLNTCLLIANGQ